MLALWSVSGNYRPISVVCMWALFAGEEQLTPVLPLTSLSFQPSGGHPAIDNR